MRSFKDVILEVVWVTVLCVTGSVVLLWMTVEWYKGMDSISHAEREYKHFKMERDYEAPHRRR